MGPSFITAAVNILPNSIVLLLEAFITGLPLLACHAFAMLAAAYRAAVAAHPFFFAIKEIHSLRRSMSII
jgi:hypothetical protein